MDILTLEPAALKESAWYIFLILVSLWLWISAVRIWKSEGKA